MSRTICLINGHPDPAPERFCHALTEAYQSGAESAGFSIERFDIGGFDVQGLTCAAEFLQPPSNEIKALQSALSKAEHLVLVYPLWLGTLPAKTKAVLEQLARDSFLLSRPEQAHSWPIKNMQGKSARVVVTMGMPGFAYRLFWGAHSLKGLETGVLRTSGFKPVKHTIFGGVELSVEVRKRMLENMKRLGAAGR